MTRTVFSLTVLAAVLLSQAAVSAAELPVRYNVEDKPLKEAVSGTNLTFDLYSDALCANLVFTQVIAIDDVQSISRLKLFTPSGGVKPPKTDTIHAVIGTSQVAAAYLKVTGTGIVPVGGACQVQSGGAAGKVVSVSPLNGSTGGSIPGSSGGYIFVGPTTYVATNAAQIMTASASLPMSMSAGSQTLLFGICYQPFPVGALVNFASGNYSTVEVTTGEVNTYSAAGAAAPGVGTWQVGVCVHTIGPAVIDDADYVNGWVMVSQ